jgi:small multidrug resistance pump
MNAWILLTLVIISEVIGPTGLKASRGFTVFIPSALVVLGYGAAFYFIALYLKQFRLTRLMQFGQD